jgi:hypothetical protein
MALEYWKFKDFCRGKTGTIYVARNGTVSVYDIEGNTYLINNNAAPAGVMKNPSDTYWKNSIDWSGSFGDYYANGMYPEDKPRYNAKPILPITKEEKEKLRTMANIWRENKNIPIQEPPKETPEVKKHREPKSHAYDGIGM